MDIFRYRIKLAEAIGDAELATEDRRTLEVLESTTRRPIDEWLLIPDEIEESIEDLWTWEDPVLAKNLGDGSAEIKLLALQLRDEFMSVRNVDLMKSLQRMIDDCRSTSKRATSGKAVQADAPKSSMEIHITGPAAVGADLIGAAKNSVRQSEVYAILAVVMTLLLIYRSPILIFLPLVAIGLSLSISTSVLALLANYSNAPDNWKLVELYSTTRVFLVVLIFGIGTDLTLFFIVRCREAHEASSKTSESWKVRVSNAWENVFGAITGSGLTTTIGLSMMAFSAFGKSKYSGIAIAISLLITLAVCLTLLHRLSQH